MSIRELAKSLIDQVPENKLLYIIAYLQGAAIPDESEKPKADTIILFIHARNPQELRGDQQQQYSFVYRWVYGALSYPSDNTPVRALDKILESGRLKDVYDRCAYYDDKVCSGEMSI